MDALSSPGRCFVIGLIGALAIGKYLAAWLSKLAFGGDRREVNLVWSLSLPQMAATLASAVVAYKTVNPAGEPLLSASYVNAVLVVVVLTCVAGPILAERFARGIAKEPGVEGKDVISSLPAAPA